MYLEIRKVTLNVSRPNEQFGKPYTHLWQIYYFNNFLNIHVFLQNSLIKIDGRIIIQEVIRIWYGLTWNTYVSRKVNMLVTF
jgi:hypothetical protein